MSKFIKNFSFFPFYFIDLFFSTSFAQSLGSGLPALNITDQGNGGTTYSLSLQMLAPNDCFNCSSISCLRNDFFHKDYNCFINFKASHGDTANTT